MEIFGSTTSEDFPTISAAKTGRFECNICLDSELNEPVVTLCGHLYCWPCIYQWLHELKMSEDHDHHQPRQNCPVCKAEISDALLVPLYGRGGLLSGDRPHDSGDVPRRPAPPKLDIDSGTGRASHAWQLEQNNQRVGVQRMIFDSYGDPDSGTETPSYSYLPALIGMFGIPYYPRRGYSHPPAGYVSPTMRRREMRVERSLHKVSFFLFCCLIMCLLCF